MSKPSTRSVTDPVGSQCWVERLQRYAAGNQTVVAFCAAEGVSESNLYLWKRRLAARPSAPASRVPSVVPLRITPSATPPVLTSEQRRSLHDEVEALDA